MVRRGLDLRQLVGGHLVWYNRPTFGQGGPLLHTERLFWQDAYCRQFDARTVEQLTIDGRPGLVLDRTCFYATSGGQPHDIGTLNGIAVVDVVEQEGRIVHLLAEPLEADAVHGEIDWARRFDHMQQHSGQHILSAAFDRLLEAGTVGFHLGDLVCTIDIDTASVSPEQVNAVEADANRVVFENRPLSVSERSAQEVAGMGLRKAPPAHDRLRIVDIDGYDVCACGGTHVRTSGEIGLIHIRRWERRKGVTRVEFLCGGRAAQDYSRRDAILQSVAQAQSVGIDELAAAVERLAESATISHHEAEHLRKRLLDAELPAISASAEEIAGAKVVCRYLEGYDAGNMRYVALHLVRSERTMALLAVSQPSPQLLFARSEDLQLDMGKLLRESAGPFGGRGGGRPHMAQGGGLTEESLTAALDAARERVRAQLAQSE